MIEYLQNIFNDEFIISFQKLFVALILGLLTGIERELSGKDAGIKTHSLVCMGSALFVIIALTIIKQFEGVTMFDPLRVTSQIIVGIGFLGAGIIFVKNKESVSGLSTAANLWLCAGTGVACGYGLYSLAILATVLGVALFIIIRLIIWIKKK